MEIDRNGLEVLGREECLRLLAGRRLGRIALSSGALPLVLPVYYAMDGESIVLRAGRETTLGTATTKAVVAFQVDDLDEHHCKGWSVAVTGLAEEVTDPKEVGRLRTIPLDRWGLEDDGHFVRISTDIVSGRRLGRRLGHARRDKRIAASA